MKKLESLENIAQEMLNTLSSYDLTHDEAFYVVNYMERALMMDLFEQTLEDYGLIEVSEIDEDELDKLVMSEEEEEEDKLEEEEENGDQGDEGEEEKE